MQLFKRLPLNFCMIAKVLWSWYVSIPQLLRPLRPGHLGCASPLLLSFMQEPGAARVLRESNGKRKKKFSSDARSATEKFFSV